MARTITIPITTDGSGNASATRNGLHGNVLAVGVDVGSGGTELADTVDVTVTDGLLGTAIATLTNVTADAIRYPKVVPTQPDGTALTTAGPAVPPVCTGRIAVAVAGGGAAKAGNVYVVIE